MSTAITTILTLLLALLPRISDNSAVTSVINMLTNLVPILVKEAQDVLPLVRNIIDLLRTKDLTIEQLDELDAVSAQVDEAFDTALENFDKENPDG